MFWYQWSIRHKTARTFFQRMYANSLTKKTIYNNLTAILKLILARIRFYKWEFWKVTIHMFFDVILSLRDYGWIIINYFSPVVAMFRFSFKIVVLSEKVPEQHCLKIYSREENLWCLVRYNKQLLHCRKWQFLIAFMVQKWPSWFIKLVVANFLFFLFLLIS